MRVKRYILSRKGGSNDEYLCRCREKCKNGKCDIVKYSEINDTLSSITKFISIDNQRYIQKYYWGYGCKVEDSSNIVLLLDIQEAIIDFLKDRKYNIESWCNSMFFSLRSQVLSIIGEIVDSYTQEYNGENKNDWYLANPNMVSYESWERAYYNRYLPVFGVSASRIEEIACFAYTLNSTLDQSKLYPVFNIISELIKECEYGIEVESKIDVCKYEYKITSYLEECNIEYEVTSVNDDCSIIEIGVNAKLNLCDIAMGAISYKEVCDLIDSISQTSKEEA